MADKKSLDEIFGKKKSLDDIFSAPKPVEPPQEEPYNMLESGLMTAGQIIAPIANKVDSYTGAPVRSAVSELQNAHGDILGAIPKAASAFKKQFGEDASQAPSATELATRAGLSPEKMGEVPVPGTRWKVPVSPAGIGGVALGAATDPLTYAGLPAVQEAAGRVAGVAKEPLMKVGSYLGENFSGIPKQEIYNYLKNRSKINANIGKYGDDLLGATDEYRGGVMSDIQSARKALNQKISSTLGNAKAAGGAPEIRIDKILKELDAAKAKLHPTYAEDAIKQIDAIKSKVVSTINDGGKTDLNNLYATQKYLRDMAKGSYSQGGQVFQVGDDAARAAKSAAAVTRKQLNSLAPDIAKANEQLALLHDIEDRASGKLLAPKENIGVVRSSGAGTNPEQMSVLQDIDKVTGGSAEQGAKDVASQARFTNPSLLPVDATGKSWTRVGAAGATAAVLGPKAYPIVGALSSPFAMKMGINAGAELGNAAAKVAPYAGGAYQVGKSSVQPQSPSKEEIMSKVQNTSYASAFRAAQKRNGADSVSTTYFLLGQSDPEFRKMFHNKE
jgi:hypothetical protein